MASEEVLAVCGGGAAEKDELRVGRMRTNKHDSEVVGSLLCLYFPILLSGLLRMSQDKLRFYVKNLN